MRHGYHDWSQVQAAFGGPPLPMGTWGESLWYIYDSYALACMLEARWAACCRPGVIQCPCERDSVSATCGTDPRALASRRACGPQMLQAGCNIVRKAGCTIRLAAPTTTCGSALIVARVATGGSPRRHRWVAQSVVILRPAQQQGNLLTQSETVHAEWCKFKTARPAHVRRRQ